MYPLISAQTNNIAMIYKKKKKNQIQNVVVSLHTPDFSFPRSMDLVINLVCSYKNART